MRSLQRFKASYVENVEWTPQSAADVAFWETRIIRHAADTNQGPHLVRGRFPALSPGTGFTALIKSEFYIFESLGPRAAPLGLSSDAPSVLVQRVVVRHRSFEETTVLEKKGSFEAAQARMPRALQLVCSPDRSPISK